MSTYRRGLVDANGSTPIYTEWLGGPALAAIDNCPIYSIKCKQTGEVLRRKARITGAADTWFSCPATVTIKGLKIKGYVTSDDDLGGYCFRVLDSQCIKGTK